MGGGKETPRQKLIGLMYLVLMALLAMNVSKSILSAFITINQKFEDSATLITGNTDAALANLDGQLAAAKGDEKKVIVAIQETAINIRKLTQETANYYVKKTSDMIIKSDPIMPTPFYDDVDGTYMLMDMDTLSKKDDYDTPGHMFLQTEDHQSPNESGDSITQMLLDYRNEVVTLAAAYNDGKKSYSFDPSKVIRPKTAHDHHDFEASLEEALKSVHEDDQSGIKRIMQLLTPPEKVHNHHDNKEYSWVAYQFDHAVIVAAAAIMTSIKNDVRMAESIAIDIITGRASVEAFKFNKIEPLAFSSTAYINQGDSLNLKVMIAAYDTTEAMELKYWVDDTLKKGEGKEFKGKAGRPLALSGSVGDHNVVGTIAVKEKGSKKFKNWKFKYSVGAPSAAVAAADLNVLYRGWKNKLKVSASGYDPSTVSVGCSGCSISKSGDFYIATVSGSGKKATIKVSAKDDKGNTVSLANEEFRIFSLPAPSIYFANQTIDKPTMSRGLAKNASKLIAKLGNSPLNVPYEVTSFDMIVVKKGKVATVSSKGNKLSGAMKNAIGNMSAGTMLTFSNVKAKGPSGKSQPIGGISFRLK